MPRISPAVPALAAALLAVPSCDWLEPQPAAEPTEPEAAAIPPHPVPRPRSEIAVPETYQQIDLLYDLQERVLELEIEIAERNEYYVANGFASFLELDPFTLPAEQVAFLKHFCDSGDFTLPREAQILLLEREIIRRRETALPSFATTDSERGHLLGRLDDTLERYEQRVADLERIASLYRESGVDATIVYNANLSPEELEAERRHVVRRQFEIGEKLDALDEEISELRDALDAFE